MVTRVALVLHGQTLQDHAMFSGWTEGEGFRKEGSGDSEQDFIAQRNLITAIILHIT